MLILILVLIPVLGMIAAIGKLGSMPRVDSGSSTVGSRIRDTYRRFQASGKPLFGTQCRTKPYGRTVHCLEIETINHYCGLIN